MTAIIGIDPGLEGGICLLCGAEPEIWDTPTLELKGRRQIDEVALAHLFDRWAQFNATVWIEQVGPMPKDGAVAAFGFGRTYGALRMAAAAQFMPVHAVAPAKWKRAMGITSGSGKDASLALASTLMPAYAHHWVSARGNGSAAKRSGRAEALLIALYGQKQGGSNV